ncbi:MAG: AmmeMemoRadiSam system protein A [Acidobacteria bacterium]|nr:AmmeMemoRadiSam system protein A [Acidobacteriota bacterium]
MPGALGGALIWLAFLPAALAPAREPPTESGPAAPGPPEPAPAGEPLPEATEVDPVAPLDAAERDILLRLAWRTLAGHLTGHPIQDSDLADLDVTQRLAAPRGCWVTLRKDGGVRGSQGEIEATRPLYHQVIVFVRRAATRDPRFLPLTALDLDGTEIEIAVIGKRERIDGPGAIRTDRHGVFLEKWGRRAVFLPGIAAARGWDAARTLDELCRQASLPAGAWSSAARLEVFTTEVIAGAQPPPATAAPAPEEAGDPPAGPEEPPRPPPRARH